MGNPRKRWKFPRKGENAWKRLEIPGKKVRKSMENVENPRKSVGIPRKRVGIPGKAGISREKGRNLGKAGVLGKGVGIPEKEVGILGKGVKFPEKVRKSQEKG